MIETSYVLKKSIMEGYSDYLIFERKVPSKAKSYIALVRKFQNYVGKPYVDILRNDILSYIFYMIEIEGLSRDYINKNLLAIKVFYEYLWKKGYIAKNPSEGISMKSLTGRAKNKY